MVICQKEHIEAGVFECLGKRIGRTECRIPGIRLAGQHRFQIDACDIGAVDLFFYPIEARVVFVSGAIVSGFYLRKMLHGIAGEKQGHLLLLRLCTRKERKKKENTQKAVHKVALNGRLFVFFSQRFGRGRFKRAFV